MYSPPGFAHRSSYPLCPSSSFCQEWVFLYRRVLMRLLCGRAPCRRFAENLRTKPVTADLSGEVYVISGSGGVAGGSAEPARLKQRDCRGASAAGYGPSQWRTQRPVAINLPRHMVAFGAGSPCVPGARDITCVVMVRLKRPLYRSHVLFGMRRPAAATVRQSARRLNLPVACMTSVQRAAVIARSRRATRQSRWFAGAIGLLTEELRPVHERDTLFLFCETRYCL